MTKRAKKNIKENCFKSVKVFKGNCYLNNMSMIFSLILNLPIKRPSVQKTLHFSAIVCSYRPTNRQYMAINGVLQTVQVNLYFIGSKRVEHGQQIIRAITSLFIFLTKKNIFRTKHDSSKFEIY